MYIVHILYPIKMSLVMSSASTITPLLRHHHLLVRIPESLQYGPQNIGYGKVRWSLNLLPEIAGPILPSTWEGNKRDA